MSAPSFGRQYGNITIASGNQTQDSFLDLQGAQLGSVMIVGGFTGSTITFTASNDGTNYYAAMHGNGTAISVAAAGNKSIALLADLFAFSRIKLVSGSSENAARTIIPFLKSG